MTKQVFSQNGFNSGQLSPLLEGRQDIAQYSRGLSQADNCVVTPRGPVSRRAGTKYIADVKTKTSNINLIPFQFNEDDSFILEFGENYIRFYKDGAQVESSPSVPLEVTTTYASGEVEDISYVQFGNTLYLAHKDHHPAQLTRKSSDTDWELKDITFAPPPTFERGTIPSVGVTPAATTGFGINFTAVTGTFLDGDVGRQIINGTGTGRATIVSLTSTAIAVCDITEDFPSTDTILATGWYIDLSPVVELTPSGQKAGEVITLDADIIGTTTAVNAFRDQDVNKYILINGGVVKTTQLISASQLEGVVVKSLNNTNETQLFSVEWLRFDSNFGFPRAIGLYQQRLVLGGIDAAPQTLWLSETGILEGFGVGPDDNDSIQVTLSSSQVNNISWVSSSRDLIIGSVGGESTLTGSTAGGAITPSSVNHIPRTYFGSSVHQPTQIGNEVLFVQRSARKVRSLRYDFGIDSYVGDDLTFLADDLTENEVKQITHVENPDSLIYATDKQGNMIVAAYDKRQEVIGWTNWTTTGNYKWVQTITKGVVDQIWCVVERTINGTVEKYIELLNTTDQDSILSCFSDSCATTNDGKAISAITKADPAVVTTATHGFSDGDKVKLIGVGGMTEVENKTYLVANKTTTTFELTDTKGNNIDSTGFTTFTSGGNAYKLFTTVSGLDHLEGETVQVKADGGSHADKTVSSGSITLDRDAYNTVVGLKYTTTIKTLTPDYDSGLGSVQGQQQRRVSPILRVHKSAIPTLNGTFKPSRFGDSTMSASVPLTTGILTYSLQSWDKEGKLTIEASDPLPLTLLSIHGTVDGNTR